MNIENLKKLLPPKRPIYTDEDLENFSVRDLYKMNLTDDETLRLRAINHRREEERQLRFLELRKAEQPIVNDLRSIGFKIEGVSDLFNRKEVWNKEEKIQPYTEALPILLRHLEYPYPDIIRSTIARALSVGRAAWIAAGMDFNLAWKSLFDLYCQEPASTNAKHGLAVALSAFARSDASLLVQIIELLNEKRHGESRGLMLDVLLQWIADPAAQEALKQLSGDPQLVKEIQAINKQLEKNARARQRRVARKKERE